jgi:hypothetical protein
VRRRRHRAGIRREGGNDRDIREATFGGELGPFRSRHPGQLGDRLITEPQQRH